MSGVLTIVREINLRHLRDHKLRAILAAGGVSAGVALAISTAVINDTLLESARGSARHLAGSAELEITAAHGGGLAQTLVRKADSVPGVTRAVPVVQLETNLARGDEASRVLVFGITPAFRDVIPRGVGEFGEIDVAGLPGGHDAAVLSSSLANDIGAGLGDHVAVETPRGEARLEVTGVVAGDLISLLNAGDVGFMPLNAAQSLFDLSGRVNSIYIVVSPDIAIEDVERSLTEELGGAVLVGPPAQRTSGFIRTFQGVATLTSLAGTAALFVAIFVVYNTIAMLVAERRKELATVLALGARRRQLVTAFLMEALFIGAAGSVLGVAGGLLIARLVAGQTVEAFRFLPDVIQVPVVVAPERIAVGVLAGVLVSLVGAYVAARRTLSIEPIQALRPVGAYEAMQLRRNPLRLSWLTALGGSCIALCVAGVVLYAVGQSEQWVVTVSLVVGLVGVTLLLPAAVPAAIRPLVACYRRFFGGDGHLAGAALVRHPVRASLIAGAVIITAGLVMGVATGLSSFEAQVERSAALWYGADLFVDSRSLVGFTSAQPLRRSTASLLEDIEGVEKVYPWRYEVVRLRGGAQAVIYAVPVAQAAREGTTSTLSATGDDQEAMIDALARGEIVVSRYTARRLGVDIGDSISLPTPKGWREFRIGGLFDDLVSYDSLYMEYSIYERLWNYRKIDRLAVLAESGEDTSEVKASLAAAVRDRGIPARVLTKKEAIGETLAITGNLFSLARGVELAALAVALLTITNTTFTSVLERRWEFGLQRTIGVSSSQLGRSLLLEAAGIGLVGGVGAALLGIALGFVFVTANEALFAWNVQLQVAWPALALTVFGGIVLAAVASIYPRRVAMRMPIVECLKYE